MENIWRTYMGIFHILFNAVSILLAGCKHVYEKGDAKKIFYPLLLVFGLITVVSQSLHADGLDTWHWRNPLPQGNTLKSVAYGNATFVAVGDNGTILQSGTVTPVVNPTPSPTPEGCTASEIDVSKSSLTIKRLKRSSVTVSVTGDGDCTVKGEKVTAKVDASGTKMVAVKPASAKTGEDGSATFTLKAKSKTGNATVTFSTGGGLSNSVNVTVTR